MKNILLLFVLVAIATGLSAQPRVDKHAGLGKKKMVVGKNTAPAGLLENTRRLVNTNGRVNTLKTTGNQQKLDSILYNELDGDDNFVVYDKDIYAYDNNGNYLSCSMYEYNDDGVMYEYYRETLAYTNNQLHGMLYYSSDEDGLLYLTGKNLFTYTSAGLVDSIASYLYNTDDESWEYDMRTKYTYNDIHQVSSVVCSSPDDYADYIESKSDYSYNGDGLLSREDYYTTSNDDGSLILSEVIKYIYTNGLLATETTYSVESDGSLTESEAIDYTYSTNGNLITEIAGYSVDGVLQEFDKDEYSYNTALNYENVCLPFDFSFYNEFDKYFANGLPVEDLYYTNDGGSWYLDSKDGYYYSDIITVGINDNQEAETLVAYPNPAVGKIYISGGTGPISCKLVDASGRTVLIAPLSADGSIDISPVKTGYYLLQVDNGNGNLQTLKVVKQ